MPEPSDTAMILAPGREILDIFTEYVTACRVLGYHHHDLTRLHDWYDTEDGLDLRALESEQRTLIAATPAAEDALRLQGKQLQLIGEGWQGSAAMSARDHLGRHQIAAEQAVTAAQTAAETLNRLREALREAVTRKVTATVEIEGRRTAQRAEWLTAARTVAGGMAGDRSMASELIDQEIRPFVANDIGGDWVAAMRAATTAVADAYADAVAALRAGPLPMFVRLDPISGSTPAVESRPPFERTVSVGYTPVESSWSTAPSVAPTPHTTPAQASAVSPLPTSGTAPLPAAGSTVVPEAAPLPAAGQSLGLPGMGGAADPGMGTGLTSGLGSSLASAGQQLADLFSGLIGSDAEGIPDADVLDAVPDDEVDDPDTPETADELEDPEEEATSEDEEPTDDESTDEEPTDDEAVDEAPAEEAPGEEAPGEEAPAEPAEVPDPQGQSPEPIGPPPPVVDAAPLAQPVGETPCEIAADELPQVGS
ncbi:hypothetical protein [Mycolicibacterium goodii]|uniref:hypothetical protein n=1 Tax=Mycolicibacterium goodii TaxID=134601 RepID=UPI001BDC790A|nr:hypothetical protein [Mycolicibacterium goodii]MBU8828312.1 hypothetical protein [Mycolicibacterium goodii]